MNPEKAKKANLKYYHRLREKVLTYYGRKCQCCGENHLQFLTLDHINNDGAKHRKEVRGTGGGTIYSWVKQNNYPDTLQILCYNCNMAKAFYKLCPHKILNNYVRAAEIKKN